MIGHYCTTEGHTVESHLITKLGLGHSIGHQNFLSYGIDCQAHPGRKESGVSLSSEYQIGPYLGFARYFAGSPIMLSLWVNPFQYDHGASVDGNGQVVHTNSRHFFQTGGFGIAYLF